MHRLLLATAQFKKINMSCGKCADFTARITRGAASVEPLLPVPGSGLSHHLHSGSSFGTCVLSYSYRYQSGEMCAVILLP